jgi:hypothetical protein
VSTPLIGATGEYYAAAIPSHAGWVASITPRNADRTDVLAQHVEDGTVVAIQVKTSSGAPQFRMSRKDEETVAGAVEWYVGVRLTAFDERPVFYVVPRIVVSALLYLDHRHFLAQPGQDGRPHKDTPQRRVDVEVWRESWTALTLEPYARLPIWTYAAYQAYGLPRDHPLQPWFHSPPYEKIPASPRDAKIVAEIGQQRPGIAAQFEGHF